MIHLQEYAFRKPTEFRQNTKIAVLRLDETQIACIASCRC